MTLKVTYLYKIIAAPHRMTMDFTQHRDSYPGDISPWHLPAAIDLIVHDYGSTK